MSGRDAFSPSPPAMIMLFSIAFAGGTWYNLGVHAEEEKAFLSQGGYDEEKNLGYDPYRRAAAESSAGDDAVGGGGRYVIDGD